MRLIGETRCVVKEGEALLSPCRNHKRGVIFGIIPTPKGHYYSEWDNLNIDIYRAVLGTQLS